MKKLSIIVPVYNVEHYVEECINSLLVQTINDFEIIVVDDGSTDKSIEKIRKFNDNRIKIILKENGGLSSARNVGLKIAKGEFITFVDSDDFINNNNAYEEMYKLAKLEKSDVVSGNAIEYYSKNSLQNQVIDLDVFDKSPVRNEEFFLKCLQNKKMYAPVWLNLYKKELIKDMFFKEGILHEDEHFIPRILMKAQQVSIYNKVFYAYRQRHGSITKSGVNTKRGYDKLQVALELESLIKDIKNDELKKVFQEYIVKFALYGIYTQNIKSVSKRYKDFIFRNSKELELRKKVRLLKCNESVYIYYMKYVEILKLLKLLIKKGVS